MKKFIKKWFEDDLCFYFNNKTEIFEIKNDISIYELRKYKNIDSKIFHNIFYFFYFNNNKILRDDYLGKIFELLKK